MCTKIVLIILSVFLISGMPAEDWHLKKNNREIAVYVRRTNHAGLKELKAVTRQKTSISSIVALLNDWETYPQWVYKCGKSVTLKRISDTEVIRYQTVVTPWPTDNRDFVVNVKVTQDQKSRIVTQTTSCIPDYIPRVKGHIRITHLNAIWKLTPAGQGMINIEYRLLIDPGGNIPESLESLAAVDGPYHTMLNLKQWIKREKYRHARLSYIQEP